MSKDVRDINGHHSKFVAAMLGHYGKAGYEVIQADTNGYIYIAYQVATAESAARIERLSESVRKYVSETEDLDAELVKANVYAAARIAELEQKANHLQSLIDVLMLEYCPDEMTEAQLAKYEAHQVAITNTGDKPT